MKQYFLYFILISLSACSYVISVEKVNFSMQNEPGKCYTSERKRDNKKIKDGFLIRIIENQYAYLKDSIQLESLEFSNSEMIRYEMSSAQISTVIKKKFACFNTNNPDAYYAICKVEVPAEYKAISITNVENLKKNGNGFYCFSRRVLLAQSYVEKINCSRKPLFLNKNEYWFKSGDWSDYQELMCSGCFAYTAKEIETAMKKLGYRMKIDNKFSKKELKRIYRFQRKNGIESGKLNIETLKKLNVPF